MNYKLIIALVKNPVMSRVQDCRIRTLAKPNLTSANLHKQEA